MIPECSSLFFWILTTVSSGNISFAVLKSLFLALLKKCSLIIHLPKNAVPRQSITACCFHYTARLLCRLTITQPRFRTLQNVSYSLIYILHYLDNSRFRCAVELAHSLILPTARPVRQGLWRDKVCNLIVASRCFKIYRKSDWRNRSTFWQIESSHNS